jgi:hypothetical protein
MCLKNESLICPLVSISKFSELKFPGICEFFELENLVFSDFSVENCPDKKLRRTENSPKFP